MTNQICVIIHAKVNTGGWLVAQQWWEGRQTHTEAAVIISSPMSAGQQSEKSRVGPLAVKQDSGDDVCDWQLGEHWPVAEVAPGSSDCSLWLYIYTLKK